MCVRKNDLSAFAHDLAGNLTADGPNVFSYNALNQMTRAAMGQAAPFNNVVDFSYDAFGVVPNLAFPYVTRDGAS